MNEHRPPAAAILAVPLIVAVVLALFAWPSSRLEPRDLPVGVAGPSAAAGAIERQLGAQEGAFDVHRYSDAAEAREAIEDREVYGALVATPDGPTVLTSSAASPAVSQLLSHAAAEQDAETEDVVATPAAGSGLGSSVLPLVLAGILTGALAALAVSRGTERAGLALGGSLLGGVAAALVLLPQPVGGLGQLDAGAGRTSSAAPGTSTEPEAGGAHRRWASVGAPDSARCYSRARSWNSHQPCHRGRVRLLIVEDDVKMAALIRRGLREERARGRRRAEAARTPSGWRRPPTYDAIVLDVMLPGIDGFEACRRLRARRRSGRRC